MNVVFFVTSLDSGGVENYLLRFLEEKHRNFLKVVIYCKSGRGGQLEAEFAALPNVELVKAKVGYLSIRGLKILRDFLIKRDIDAVCDFTGNFSGLVLKLSKAVGIGKRIAFYRGSSDHFKKNFLKSLYNKWVKMLVLRNATDILSNSKSALNYFFYGKWEKDERFEVIQNGINANSFLAGFGTLRSSLNIPNEVFVVGHTGRFNQAKNHKMIMKVAEKLVLEYEDIYFILCGNGVKSNLQPFLRNESLKRRILVFENRKDIPKFLRTMDCFFFPSLTEGQPNSLIEAMLVGIPFVASNIDPIKETVPAQYHAQLIEPHDINAAIQKILLIRADLKRKERFDMLKKWSQEYFSAESQFTKFLDRLKYHG